MATIIAGAIFFSASLAYAGGGGEAVSMADGKDLSEAPVISLHSVDIEPMETFEDETAETEEIVPEVTEEPIAEVEEDISIGLFEGVYEELVVKKSPVHIGILLLVIIGATGGALALKKRK